jgi:hypothetical protein
MAGWSKNTQVELRTLLRALGQATEGSKAALVQRLTAFLADDGSEATGDEGSSGPSASEATELAVAGATTELNAWRAATSHLGELTTSLAQQRATAKAAAAAARAVLHPHRVRHNEQSCPLLQLVGQDDLRPTFMRAEVWGVVGLWRLRGVCRAFRGWARAELSSLPRVVAVGGVVLDSSSKWCWTAHYNGCQTTSSVELLDLSTMCWSVAGCMPSLPDPRALHSVSCCADGRVMVCGGFNAGGADQMEHLSSTALQWLPGTDTWSALADLPAGRSCSASVRLPDGRTMLIGGISDVGHQVLASVLVLAANGSGWSDLPPMSGGRIEPAAELLPDGKVLVAGGMSDTDFDTALNTAELWDPATQKWTALPPMAHERLGPTACVLPSRRVAVVGGAGADGKPRKDGEVFDPVKREWAPLGAEMVHEHGNTGAVAVAGGLLAVGGASEIPPELYDEQTRRWLKLPHAMVEPRDGAGLVSVPVAALTVA